MVKNRTGEKLMARVTTEWKSGMVFDSEVNGHHLIMDADEEFGGRDRGPRPKHVVLSALGGCTGMDVASLLKKMRVEVEGFSVRADADVAEDHPKVFTRIHLTYTFRGRNLPEDKLRKAVDLSQERYCSVSAMLRKACALTYEIETVQC
jgi:putative redox protein